MMVFKSNLDDISNIPYKDKCIFMIHSYTEKSSTENPREMETVLNPQYDRFDGHQLKIENTFSSNFLRKLNSSNQQGRENTITTLKVPGRGMEQPLDLSPVHSPRTPSPKTPTTCNEVTGDSNKVFNSQRPDRSSISPGNWMVNENSIFKEDVSQMSGGGIISPNASPPRIPEPTPLTASKLSFGLSPPSPFQTSCSNSPSESPGRLQHGGENHSKRYKYEPILPPCQVCGDNASGYHYGANTCEACKVSDYVHLNNFSLLLFFKYSSWLTFEKKFYY